MVIEYESTQEDLIEFNLFHIDNSKSIQKQLFLTRTLGGLFIFLVPLALGLIQYTRGIINVFFIPLIAGALFYFWYPKYYRSYATKHVKKMLSEGNNKALLGKQTITLSPDGVLSKSLSGESKILWSSVERITQNEKFIFIYIGAVSAYVIPKRAFISLNDQNQFLEYINKNMMQEGKL